MKKDFRNDALRLCLWMPLLATSPLTRDGVAVSAFLHPRGHRRRRITTIRSGSQRTWAPQDLTQESPGFEAIPDSDYIKQYQRKPELWPVEFFLIVYRRQYIDNIGTTQVLVRKSANGTSKYGLGTGVPVTRWMLSTAQPPLGYTFREPLLLFDARNFPEFPQGEKESSWTFSKVDILSNAFETELFQDSELKNYAEQIRSELQTVLSTELENVSKLTWESSCLATVQKAVNTPNCAAAIQGTLRMSGLFEIQQGTTVDSPHQRFLSFAQVSPAQLSQSMRIYTMFPQMPDPMLPPTAPPAELQEEIASRPFRMAQAGRNPHQDTHGRIYTHISTNNVSNTVQGVYLTLDATDIPGLDNIPALDLFGTTYIQREWVSLEDLLVLDKTNVMSTIDPKPAFISGFIVRQLVKEGVIQIHRS